MEKQLDVYRDWLGITETARPLDHYQLLRLPRFEDDAAKIRAVYRKMNAHVRKFATGEYAAQSQALLNELAQAMLCLTDAERKREYDATLGRKDTGAGRRRTFEEILLANKVITPEQLTKARNFAEAVGLSVRDAVVQQKLASADVVMMGYAESLGLPYVELDDLGVDEKLAAAVPSGIARQYACVPLMISEGRLLMASPNPLVPDVEEELRLRFNMPVRSVLCTAVSVNQAIAKYFPRDAATTPAPVKRPAAAKPAPTEPAPEAPPAAPVVVDKEQARKRALLAVATFALTVFLCAAVKALLFKAPYNALTAGAFAVFFVIAAVAAGAAFAVSRRFRL